MSFYIFLYVAEMSLFLGLLEKIYKEILTEVIADILKIIFCT